MKHILMKAYKQLTNFLPIFLHSFMKNFEKLLKTTSRMSKKLPKGTFQSICFNDYLRAKESECRFQARSITLDYAIFRLFIKFFRHIQGVSKKR